jgi:hypothetical protein
VCTHCGNKFEAFVSKVGQWKDTSIEWICSERIIKGHVICASTIRGPEAQIRNTRIYITFLIPGAVTRGAFPTPPVRVLKKPESARLIFVADKKCDHDITSNKHDGQLQGSRTTASRLCAGTVNCCWSGYRNILMRSTSIPYLKTSSERLNLAKRSRGQYQHALLGPS